MEPRLNYFGHPLAGKVLKHINSAGTVVSVATAVDWWGRLDVLVNNAGTTAVMPLAETERSVITGLFDLNVTAPSMRAHAALPHLRDSSGCIVNVSSTYGHRPLPGGSHYAATKSAMEQLTRSWALELVSEGVRVNAIAPGPTKTDVLAAAGLPQDTIDEMVGQERDRIPTGRLDDPEDIAHWILRIADPLAAHITGQVLTIGEGLELVRPGAVEVTASSPPGQHPQRSSTRIECRTEDLMTDRHTTSLTEAAPSASAAIERLEPLRYVRTDVLDVAYHEAGPKNGDTVLLLHGFPYDIHSYVDVAPLLAEDGFRVIVPYLRGHGPTTFLDEATPRSGQQAALGSDVIALMDALGVEKAYLAGYDWGGRAACVAAAVQPERCLGLVSVNGYLIQDLSTAMTPISPDLEAGFWYFYYFLTERGRAGLAANAKEIARVIWTRNSPAWQFSEEVLERAAGSFSNPDYVDIVIHSYRHRLGFAAGCTDYEKLESLLAQQPGISVPAVTLDGLADGNFPATDGVSSAHHFTGPRLHRQVRDAGHNLPQERPEAFAAAVRDVRSLRQEHSARH